MNHNKSCPLARRVAVGGIVTAVIAVSGCHTAPSPPDFDAATADISGVVRAIEFKYEGEPIDVQRNQETLTTHAVIEAALRHDPEIQIRLARVRAALAEAKQARLLPNPILSVVVRFPDSGGDPEIEAGLAADLLSLLQLPRKTSAADHRLRVASAEVLAAVLDSVSAVQERLIDAQGIEAEEQVNLQRNQLVGQLLELARARVEAGEASQLDVLAPDAERLETEAESIELRARGAEHQIGLARLLGQPSSATHWHLPSLNAPTIEAYDERGLVEAALTQRPELQAVEWELAALGDDAALTRAWWSEGGSVGLEAERDGEWAIGPGASVPLPLFDWGQARREKTHANVVEARHRLTQVRRKVVEEVRQAVTAIKASVALYAKVQNEFLPLAQRRHDQAEVQYRAGEADVTTLLQAEQQLLSARSKLIQAQQNARRAEVRLQRAVGKRTLPSE